MQDMVVGVGPKAWKGAMIKCSYIGKLENGKKFDESRPG
jgi:FKBP-type peptidyl-prolyl cis-trans isomerase